MHRRIEFHNFLKNITKLDNIYFQPPSNVKLNYPCILYSLNDSFIDSANNNSYKIEKEYQIILIDKNPDSNYVDIILSLPRINFDRFYTSENLNHYVFSIIF